MCANRSEVNHLQRRVEYTVYGFTSSSNSCNKPNVITFEQAIFFSDVLSYHVQLYNCTIQLLATIFLFWYVLLLLNHFTYSFLPLQCS